ncbi:MAG: hypothetical protein U5K38_01190 [Woeseiaceae bacterium]|nr:hypothetical protein [Woeseiaceae bacterium]
MPDFQLLSLDQTADVGEQLRDQERIGIDTEFMRESTYFPQLCLIQVAIDEQLFCIDPLDSASPGGFWDALHSPAWVLHSGRQDLEVMSQVAEQLPARVFDTQIAAALLGYAPQLGYANLGSRPLRRTARQDANAGGLVPPPAGACRARLRG